MMSKLDSLAEIAKLNSSTLACINCDHVDLDTQDMLPHYCNLHHCYIEDVFHNTCDDFNHWFWGYTDPTQWEGYNDEA